MAIRPRELVCLTGKKESAGKAILLLGERKLKRIDRGAELR